MKTIVLCLQNCSGSGLWIDRGYLSQGREKWSFPPCKREVGMPGPVAARFCLVFLFVKRQTGHVERLMIS